MKGYKVFNPNWKCRGFQFELGKTFTEDVNPKTCERGFHFCTNLSDCFNYYSFDPHNRVAEIEALGVISEPLDGDTKRATNKIKVIKELSWHEVLDLVNSGYNNSGYRNSGNYNSGYRNSGNYNSGYRNSGNYNSGNYNSGYRNSGNYNSGDFNKCDYSSGCFNTIEQTMYMFNRPVALKLSDWRKSAAFQALDKIDFSPNKWVSESEMTPKEKDENPNYKTLGGYLKTRDVLMCFDEWWDEITLREKEIIKAMPNFDSDVFYEITGLRV